MMDAFVMLQELLEQNQFELIFRKSEETQKNKKNEILDKEIRLVYLMNDTVEGFLVFQKARMTGAYQKDYEGELEASISHDGKAYVLIVRQGDSVITIFFEDLLLEVHLYDYGEVGHLWVEKYEYLRQLEYRIAILRDKLEYLGEEFCTFEEQKLAALADFPPLNYCCYPSVPDKYIVPREDGWMPSEEAIAVMEELAEHVGDYWMKRILGFYRRYPRPVVAKMIARMLHRNAHAELVDLLNKKLRDEAAVYPRRSFGKETDKRYMGLIKWVKKRQKELKLQGRESILLREEPFVSVKDGVDFQVYLLIWKKGLVNRKVKVERYKLSVVGDEQMCMAV